MTLKPPEIAFDQNLVLIGLTARRAEEAIEILSDKLRAQGYVDDDYSAAVIKREHEFPTGLPTPIPVALPHTDAGHCRRSALAVGILRAPVEFHEMGNPENTLAVRAVFLLALADPKDQVGWLQRFMRGLRDQSFLERLTKTATEQEVVDLVTAMLQLKPADGTVGSEISKEETA